MSLFLSYNNDDSNKYTINYNYEYVFGFTSSLNSNEGKGI